MKKITYIVLYGLFFFSLHSLRAQNNLGFELTSPGTYTSASAVSGWTLSSQTNSNTCQNNSSWIPGSQEFSIIATPVLFPVIGIINTSPLGGNNVARLNSSVSNSSVTKLSQTFTVNPSNTDFQYAYACLLQDGNHLCCDQSFFSIQVKDAMGSVLSCLSRSVMTPGPSCPTGQNGFSTTTTGSAIWCNWQVNTFDLSLFTGSVITLEVIVGDCTFSEHYGTLFFDAGFYFPVNNSTTWPSFPMYVCAGSQQASVCGPLGYLSYSWTVPPGVPLVQPSSPCLTVSNPTVGTHYTLTAYAYSGCVFQAVYTVTQSTVAITATGTQASCQGGASGSATVAANGSGTGFNYSWTNANNSVIATSSLASGLAPGSYTVKVTASGSQSASCGTSTAAVLIATNSVLSSVLRPFCGDQAYLSLFGNNTNLQWYDNNLAPISPGIGGTAASYTVSNAVSGDSYVAAYTASSGCRDSVRFILFSASLGSVSVIQNPSVCIGATNGMAVFSLTPTSGTTNMQNSFFVSSTGTTTAYNASLSPTSQLTFTITGLSAGGTYSLSTFDGSCQYTMNLLVNPYRFNYSFSPPTLSVCSSNTAQVFVNIAAPNSNAQYTYTWIPGAFQNTTYLNQSSMVFSPSVPMGSFTYVYTLTATPLVINCPLTKTFSLTVLNLPAPTVVPDSIIICAGEAATLIASGASSFSWNAGTSGAEVIVSPSITTSYTATGTCSASIVVTVTVSPCTSLQEVSLQSELLKLYPNPSNGIFLLETGTDVKVIITDNLGRILLERHFEKGKYRLDLSSYPAGVYSLKATGKVGTKVLKLIKEE